MHRQAINRGRVAYEPNSLGGGCPFQAGAAGFVSFPARAEKNDHKVRGKAERFADHYTQATLFFNSQTPVEQQHIINAFRFELSKVQVPAIRERMVSGLMNVSAELAEAVAEGLGITEMPAPMPKVLQKKVRAEVTESKPLSLFARRGEVGIQTRRIAMLIADGVNGEQAQVDRRSGSAARARCRCSSRRSWARSAARAASRCRPTRRSKWRRRWCSMRSSSATATTAPRRCRANGRALEFVKDQYRHCKAIFVSRRGVAGARQGRHPDSSCRPAIPTAG